MRKRIVAVSSLMIALTGSINPAMAEVTPDACKLEYQPGIRPSHFRTQLRDVAEYQRLLFDFGQITVVKFLVDREKSLVFFQNTTLYKYHRDFAEFEEFGLKLPSDGEIEADQGHRYITGSLVFSPCPKTRDGRPLFGFNISLPSEPSFKTVRATFRLLSEKVEFESQPLRYLCSPSGCSVPSSILANVGVETVEEGALTYP